MSLSAHMTDTHTHTNMCTCHKLLYIYVPNCNVTFRTHDRYAYRHEYVYLSRTSLHNVTNCNVTFRTHDRYTYTHEYVYLSRTSLHVCRMSRTAMSHSANMTDTRTHTNMCTCHELLYMYVTNFSIYMSRSAISHSAHITDTAYRHDEYYGRAVLLLLYYYRVTILESS